MPYTYQAAVDFVQDHVKGIPLTDIDESVCDMVQSMIWNAYPWRWATSAFTPITLIHGVQDYPTPNPSNFYRLTRPRIRRTDLTPPEFYDLRVMRWYAPELRTLIPISQVSGVAENKGLATLRLTSAVSIPPNITAQLEGEYQRTPTQIVNLIQTIPHPDHYYMTTISGLLWLIYKFSNDERAGSLQVVRGQAIYTGQMGEFYDQLTMMKEAEEWGQGDTTFPEESLGATHAFTPFTQLP